MINVIKEIEAIIQLKKDGYRDITGELDYLKHRLIKEAKNEIKTDK